MVASINPDLSYAGKSICVISPVIIAFDVTPNELIAGIITEDGILEPPFESSIKEFMITKKH